MSYGDHEAIQRLVLVVELGITFLKVSLIILHFRQPLGHCPNGTGQANRAVSFLNPPGCCQKQGRGKVKRKETADKEGKKTQKLWGKMNGIKGTLLATVSAATCGIQVVYVVTSLL